MYCIYFTIAGLIIIIVIIINSQKFCFMYFFPLILVAPLSSHLCPFVEVTLEDVISALLNRAWDQVPIKTPTTLFWRLSVLLGGSLQSGGHPGLQVCPLSFIEECDVHLILAGCSAELQVFILCLYFLFFSVFTHQWLLDCSPWDLGSNIPARWTMSTCAII